MTTKTCRRCGALFETTKLTNQRKYCAPCSRDAHREAKYAYRDRQIIAQCSGKHGAAA